MEPVSYLPKLHEAEGKENACPPMSFSAWGFPAFRPPFRILVIEAIKMQWLRG
jgi:hypothetical protein